MIHSMTGFGEASEHVDGVHYAVEVRSLNNRYFKPSIRLPEDIASLEAELEAQLRKRLTRGSITLSVKMKTFGAEAAQQINDAALLSYLDRLEEIQRKLDDQRQSIMLNSPVAFGLTIGWPAARCGCQDRARAYAGGDGSPRPDDHRS